MKTKHRASIGIALVSEYWNQGIGTKMFEEMICLAEIERIYYRLSWSL